jgi:hypothetical protein
MYQRQGGTEQGGERVLLRSLQLTFRYPWKAQSGLHRALGVLFPNGAPASIEAAAAPVLISTSGTNDAALLKAERHFRRSTEEAVQLAKHGRYLVTSAQNNTEPEWPFFNALKKYAGHIGAQLLVIPIRYKNPTSRVDPQEKDGADYWWHPALEPYLIENELRVHPHLVIQADLRIQATSPQPLAGLKSRSGSSSAIYGHSQLSMESVATPQNTLPKLLYTTGSVTKKNYSRTRQGNLGDFHHSHAAIVVEVQDGLFHMREVTWSREHLCFIDLDLEVHPDEVVRAPAPVALITGDEHVWWHSPEVRSATYDAPDCWNPRSRCALTCSTATASRGTTSATPSRGPSRPPPGGMTCAASWTTRCGSSTRPRARARRTCWCSRTTTTS